MKERSLPSGDIQMWPFLTTQPRITPRLPSPSLPRNTPQAPFLPPRSLEKPRASPSRPSNKWRLKQTKDDDDDGVCLLSVLARTEFNHPPGRHSPLLSPSRLSRGGERKNIVAGFLFRLAKRFCLMVRAMPSKGRPLSEPWWHTPMRKSKFLGCTEMEEL